jgi:hypothetical protein
VIDWREAIANAVEGHFLKLPDIRAVCADAVEQLGPVRIVVILGIRSLEIEVSAAVPGLEKRVVTWTPRKAKPP